MAMNFEVKYKSEAGSLKLSGESKDRLKELLFSRVEASNGQKAVPIAEKTGENNKSSGDIKSSKDAKSSGEKKLAMYKYLSLAACLVASISLVGIFSVMSTRFKVANHEPSSQMNNDSGYSLSGSAKDYEELDLEEDIPLEYGDDSSDGVALGDSPSAENDLPVEDYAIPEIAVETEEIYDDNLGTGPMPVTSDYDTDSSEGVSPYASVNYTGDYYTEDYVIMLSERPEIYAESVYNDSEDFYSLLEASLTDSSLSHYDFPEAMNFYDVLEYQLEEENELCGANLVRLTINGVSGEQDYRTLYDVTINYDYLNQESCQVDGLVWLEGSSKNQLAGMPVYDSGDVILCSLIPTSEGLGAVSELLYDVYELSGTDIAYHRYYSAVDPGYTDMGILPTEAEFITTTENNPVLYTHKAAVRELTRYIRRKVNGEDYRYSDISLLMSYSRGELSVSELSALVDSGSEEALEQPQAETVQEAPISSIGVNSADDRMIIQSGETRIYLSSEETTSYLLQRFITSYSGITQSQDETNVLFVGGKLVFNSGTAFQGELVGLEVSSADCPLDISFNGLRVGDSVDLAKSVLRIERNLSDDVTITYRGESLVVTLKFEYGSLARITAE